MLLHVIMKIQTVYMIHYLISLFRNKDKYLLIKYYHYVMRETLVNGQQQEFSKTGNDYLIYITKNLRIPVIN